MERGGGDINFLPPKRVGPLERDLFEKGGGLNRGFTVYVLLLAECRHTMTSLLLQSPKTRSFFFSFWTAPLNNSVLAQLL